MDYYYNKEFGITFKYIDYSLLCSKNTWTDYHLIPKSRPFVPPPPVKTLYLDVPGLNERMGYGKLDYTDALLGRPALNNRSGSWEFIFANDAFNTSELLYKLRIDLNGKLTNVILNGDPEYFYRGRVQVSEVTRSEDGSPLSITLDYNLSPYKYSVDVMTWPYDPVVKPDYSTTAMLDVYVETVSDEIYIFNNGPLTRVHAYVTGPTMSVNVTNRLGTNTYSIDLGRNDDLFYLAHGRNILRVYGNGRFQLYYCEGRL